MTDFTFRTLDTEKTADIEAARAVSNTTRRTTVPVLEELMHRPLAVLDHGLIRVVDYMGDDSAIVQAARVSYGKGTKKASTEAGLIHYLLSHRHSTPFEMCEIKLHIKMPIFVMRQWIRHRTANVNEYSARYSILAREFYFPQTDVLAAQSKNNKQGRDATSLPPEESAEILRLLQHDAAQAYDTYEYLINDDGDGNPKDPSRCMLARELARMNLPVNVYTECYWKIDLHNLLHFLGLRNDAHAQYEIRVFAETIWNVVQQWVPMAAAAFENVRMNGISLTGRQLKVLQAQLDYLYGWSPSSGPMADYFKNLTLDEARKSVPEIGKRELDELKTALLKGL